MKLELLFEDGYWKKHRKTKHAGLNFTDRALSREDHISTAKRAGLPAAKKAIQYMLNMSKNSSIDRIAQLRQILSWINTEMAT